MELLNLDALVEVTREVNLGGETYAVATQTVGMMLDAIAAAKLVEEGNEGDEMFMRMVSTCRSILPAAPEDVIRAMNFEQMTALVQYATASEQEVIESSEQEEEEGKSESKQ